MSKAEDVDDWLTVQQAAEILDVSDGAVRQALLGNHLAHEMRYGRKLISRTALAEYQQRTQPDGVKRVGRPRKQSM